MSLSNDAPISNPNEDLFGLDPFAHAIARSIEHSTAPNGLVLAINGAWGSGKSSAINLILHHMQDQIGRGELVQVTFNPWWFNGADTLALAFFHELNVAIGPSLSKKARTSFEALGRGVSAMGPLLAAAANLKVPGLGGFVSGAINWLAGISKTKRTVEQEHHEIAKSLADKTKKFLVIIDDIDRLSTDDALTIFRLVKSVGRLPNVIYLLAFDRDLAERAVSARFPSEGPSYLEKIVQTSFEVPPPPVDILRKQALDAAVRLIGEPHEALAVRFMNVFYDVVAPLIRTPRDVVRLVNDLTATWPAVAGDVDRADFFGLTAIRLSMPTIYRAVRDNPEELCGIQSRDGDRRGLAETYDRLFKLGELSPPDQVRWRKALRRLFPRLDSVWSNTWHSGDSEWERQRRVCSPGHFRTYFAFAIPEDALSAEEITILFQRADDADFVRQRFRENLALKRPDGSTRASLLLDELTVHASEVEQAKIASLTATLFAIADELDVESDERRGFSIGNNTLRMHWLMNRLVNEQFDLEAREPIYRSAMEGAEMGWCCDFAARCRRAFGPVEEGQSRGTVIVSEPVADEFKALALSRLRAAAKDGRLIDHRRLPYFLFEWRRISDEGAAEVRRWTDQQLENPRFVVAMAKGVPNVSWSQGMGFDGMGDRVARRRVTVDAEPYSEMLDIDRLERRVEDLVDDQSLSVADREILQAYRDAPRERHGA